MNIIINALKVEIHEALSDKLLK